MVPASYLFEVGIIVVMTVVIWVGSSWLEGASEQLSEHYGLPQVVQGSVVAAVGSSFPELATVAFAALLTNSLGLGVGAVVGSAVFNVLVIPAVAAIATEDNIESNRMLVYKEAQFYMLAVSVLVITFAMAVIYYPDTSVDYLAGEVTRPLALILGAVHQLVEAVEALGLAFGIPEFIMGVTVAAGATSLPDALVSVRAARDDRGVASLANVLGSNTFDLLVAIPVGVLILGDASFNFAMAVPMFAVLTLATVLLFTVLRTDLHLSTPESAALLVSYLLFVAWVVVETLTTVVDYTVGHK
jgi:cation:H+ antiporter